MESAVKSKLTKKQLECIVETHFPGSELSEVTELTDGNISSAYILRGTGGLENAVVLKTGMTSGAEGLRYEKDLFPTEIKVYELLQDKDLPIPRILGYSLEGLPAQDANEAISFPYFFMEYVEGQTWVKSLEEAKGSRPELMEKLGYCNGVINGVTGPYFGYLKEGEEYHFPTWGEAFSSMMFDILQDGREKHFDLPDKKIEEILAKNLELLNQIAVPRLVDFDLWAGNVFLRRSAGQEGISEGRLEKLEIAGIIDFGHCFFGDPFACFTSAVHLFKNVEEEPEFRKGYEAAMGVPLTVTENDRIRMDLYRLYMALLCTVETYRYEPKRAEEQRRSQMRRVLQLVEKLEG